MADTELGINGEGGSPIQRLEKKTSCQKFTEFLFKNLLLILMILSLVLGCCVGFGIKLGSDRDFTSDEIKYISFPGTIFLNMLKVMIIPLVVSSLIAGMASINKQASSKLGLRAVLYYFTTTFIAVVLGIILVMTIRPGARHSKDDIDTTGNVEKVNTVDAFLDLIRVMFPPNIIEATFRTYKTRQVPVDVEPTMMPMMQSTAMMMDSMMNTTDTMATDSMMNTMMNSTTMNTPMITNTMSVGGYEFKSNILGLVVFSCIFGAVLGRLGEKGEPLKDVVESLMECVIVLIGYIIWLSPIGVFFLILGKILGMDDWALVFQQIGLYSATVMLGLFIHGFIILPLLYLIFTRSNPFAFLKGVAPAMVTAFATSSSSATLPVTITSLENNNKIDKRVTRFILPIGATINMDGTALYEAVAAIFIAQINDYDLSVVDVIVVSITATLASVGAAGVPQAGLVTLVIVLNALGLPADDITHIIVIDWFLDRCRTTVNVEGDSFGCGIIYKFLKPDFDRIDEENMTKAMVNGYANEKKIPIDAQEGINTGEDTRL
ncbi:excitatory amino acid transporter 3-like [Lytechinus variegatus]|uniref:excitatory amino acid transporter 3-like n=1 Tax=Lytechinus variegatus TaxID=7654 RepID=UPI001BB236CD|nr:excitatory amino acid transporter 3-like [Lytechinus variegatus]